MTSRWRRRLAAIVCGALRLVLPARMADWGRAVRHELAAIDDDREALGFALGSLAGLAPRAIVFHLIQLPAMLIGADGSSSGAAAMGFYGDMVRRPRAIGVACAIGASGLGIAYLAAAGAPIAYPGVNAAALAIGLAMLAAIGRGPRADGRATGPILLALAAVLLGTALLAPEVEGAARWVRIGPLFVQPSLILLPAMAIAFARARDRLSTVAMVVAAVAMALQPDRAMAGMLAAALAISLAIRRDRRAVAAFASGAAGFAVTLARADTLPAVPYVDRILTSSFALHPLAGLAVLGGSALLLVPAVLGGLVDRDRRATYAAFGTAWLAIVAAAALGNYPTPLVGYGGSAVLGYVLSLIALPRAICSAGAFATAGGEPAGADGPRVDRRRAPISVRWKPA